MLPSPTRNGKTQHRHSCTHTHALLDTLYGCLGAQGKTQHRHSRTHTQALLDTLYGCLGAQGKITSVTAPCMINGGLT